MEDKNKILDLTDQADEEVEEEVEEPEDAPKTPTQSNPFGIGKLDLETPNFEMPIISAECTI